MHQEPKKPEPKRYTTKDWPIQTYAFWVKNGFKPVNIITDENGRRRPVPVYAQKDYADVELQTLELKLITDQLADLTAELDVGLYDDVQLQAMYASALALKRQAEQLVTGFTYNGFEVKYK